MMLYVSIVLLAEIAALPDDLGVPELLAIVWGTTIGLALAHWFAFEFATGRLRGRLPVEAIAEVAGGALVAAIVSVPILVLPHDVRLQVVPFVIAFVIGGVSYAAERAHGYSRRRSVYYATVTLVVGLVVATVKDLLAYH